jgi:hypothetical protein
MHDASSCNITAENRHCGLVEFQVLTLQFSTPWVGQEGGCLEALWGSAGTQPRAREFLVQTDSKFLGYYSGPHKKLLAALLIW